MRIRDLVKEYFVFSKSQQRGIIVLLVLIVISAITPFLYTLFYNAPIVSDKEKENIKQSIFQKQENDVLNDSTSKFNIVSINPNTASDEEFRQLGFSETAIKSIVNYRNKGGRFVKKEDLKKMYGIDAAFYNKIKNFMVIQQSEHVATIIDMNTADSMMLLNLQGIGAKLTSRIIKYRNLLGGFYNIYQLKEVYGISDSLFNTIKSQIFIKDTTLSKINVNSMNYSELNKHPYITSSQAKEIILYRKNHAYFKSINDLKAVAVFPDSVLQKLIPYLSLSN